MSLIDNFTIKNNFTLEKTEGLINGKYRDTHYLAHEKNEGKQDNKNTTQHRKLKKMSNTYSIKNIQSPRMLS
jgi:hypothetical protein